MEHITDKKINIAELIENAHHPEAGALVIFSGEARNHHEGKNVESLEYEAHLEMAESAIREIINQARARWNLKKVVAIHRVGKVEISEPAVVVITSGAHRSETYEANRYIIDEIKSKAPIWKKEVFPDGKSSWQ